MSEPLKNKEKDSMRELIRKGFHTRDVKSAVEWLKEDIEKTKRKYPHKSQYFNDELQDLLNIIDTAFEDVK